MREKSIIGNLLLTLTAMIWGTAFVFQRRGMETIEPVTFNAARMVLAAIAVGAVAVLNAKKEKRKNRLPEKENCDARRPAGAVADEGGYAAGKESVSGKKRTGETPVPWEKAEAETRSRYTVTGGICCGVFLSTASIFQQMGIVYTTAGKAGFITAMYMILVPVIGFLLFRRKNTWLVWTAVLIGVAGMYLLCMTEGFSLTRGDTLVCICALLFSCHILCCDYFAPRGEPIAISAIQFVTCSVISAAVALIAEEPTWQKLVSAAVPILYCGLLSGGVGYTLQIVAQKFTDPTIASLLMSLESVFAVLAGAVLLHERMTPREMAGCAVMFLAILLVQIPLPDRSRKKVPEN